MQAQTCDFTDFLGDLAYMDFALQVGLRVNHPSCLVADICSNFGRAGITNKMILLFANLPY